ncbi:hypothetical protein WDU94_010566 [Cyamophila willieti]
MISRSLLISFIILGVLAYSHQAVIGVSKSVAQVNHLEDLRDLDDISVEMNGRNLDMEDYEVQEAPVDLEDELVEGPPQVEPRSDEAEARSQMGSAMAGGMQTGGTTVDKFGSGLASWGNSVANFGQGWTNMGQSVQTIDEKLG